MVEFLKPEVLVLIPILHFLRNLLKRYRYRKREIDIFFILLALVLSVGYVLSTSEIKDLRDLWNGIWTGISQGMICLSVCRFTLREGKTRKIEKNIQTKSRAKPRG